MLHGTLAADKWSLFGWYHLELYLNSTCFKWSGLAPVKLSTFCDPQSTAAAYCTSLSSEAQTTQKVMSLCLNSTVFGGGMVYGDSCS
jgi:hypothetical protein